MRAVLCATMMEWGSLVGIEGCGRVGGLGDLCWDLDPDGRGEDVEGLGAVSGGGPVGSGGRQGGR